MAMRDASLIPPLQTTATATVSPRHSAEAVPLRFDEARLPVARPRWPRGADAAREEPPEARAGSGAPTGQAVRQTVRSVVLEVQPTSAEVLQGLIVALRAREGATESPYDRLKRQVPALHFMSMTVFEDAHYDPIFVVEVNFDGAPGPFWAQLEAAIGPDLRGMLRCCKTPRDRAGALFQAVTAADSRRLLAPFLELLAARPAIHHVGNRGLARDRIVRQRDLFFAAQDELGDGLRFQGRDPADVHRELRQALLPRFPWLADRPAPRIARAERAMDVLRLATFAVLVLLGLSLPGLALTLLLPDAAALGLSTLAAAVLAAGLWWLRERRSEPEPGAGGAARSLVAAAAAFMVALGVLSTVAGGALALLDGRPFGAAFLTCASFFAPVLLGVVATVLALLLWLRRLERRDPSQDEPPLDEEAMEAMARREDLIVQNHMGSVVLLKPGVLRAVLIRLGLWGLGLFLRVTATDGYLGSMRTIHFAHWALVSNGSRLMFFSNFDGSWESYLDDFIEKAHAGLTLAWSSGIGFPATRYLVLDGASQGRKFKAWARHSMAESLFWFSAYEDLTVNEIERHSRVADGLSRPTLTPEEAATWTRQL